MRKATLRQARTNGAFLSHLWLLFQTVAVAAAAFFAPCNRCSAAFTFSSASSYAILYEGYGGHNLQITNVTINGNVGVGMPGSMTVDVPDSGPSTINGRIDFQGPNVGQFMMNNANDVVTGGENYNVAAVASALSTVNSLNSTLGAEPGTALPAINLSGTQTYTIDASNGIDDGNGDRVFTLSNNQFNQTNSNIIYIDGDGLGENVLINITNGQNFDLAAQVVLEGGLTADDVLFNVVGTPSEQTNHSGAPQLNIHDGGSSITSTGITADFLDPDGAISVENSNVFGRVFGGDSQDDQIVSGTTLTQPVPEPSSLLMFAALAGGFMAARLCGCPRVWPARIVR